MLCKTISCRCITCIALFSSSYVLVFGLVPFVHFSIFAFHFSFIKPSSSKSHPNEKLIRTLQFECGAYKVELQFTKSMPDIQLPLHTYQAKYAASLGLIQCCCRSCVLHVRFLFSHGIFSTKISSKRWQIAAIFSHPNCNACAVAVHFLHWQNASCFKRSPFSYVKIQHNVLRIVSQHLNANAKCMQNPIYLHSTCAFLINTKLACVGAIRKYKNN